MDIIVAHEEIRNESSKGSCGSNGGKNRFGAPCEIFNGLDENGRCKDHPVGKERLNVNENVYNATNEFVQRLIEDNRIFATKLDGVYSFYIKKGEIFHLLRKSEGVAYYFIIESVKDDADRGAWKATRIINDFKLSATIEINNGNLEIRKPIDVNRRKYYEYRINDQIIDIRENKKIENKGYTDNYPELKQPDLNPGEYLPSFIRSFGKGFPQFIARLLHPPVKQTVILIGESSSGKSALLDIMRDMFVDVGISDLLGKDFGRNQFGTVERSVATDLITLIDEVEKGKKKLDWDNLFNYLGRSVMSVELKHENPRQMQRLGNSVFIGNTAPDINIYSDAVKNRINPRSVWVVGNPDIDYLVDKYANFYFGKSKSKMPMSVDDFKRLIDSTRMELETINNEYKKPFGELTEEQWNERIEEMRDHAPFLLSLLFEEIAKGTDNVDDIIQKKQDNYYQYFERVADLHRMSLGDMVIKKQWMSSLLDDMPEILEDKEINDIDLSEIPQ